MLDGLDEGRWPAGAQLHVALDDDGLRHVVRTGPRAGRKTAPTEVVEGTYEALQRVGSRTWQVPVTAFWQAHRDAARVYSDLIAEWARPESRSDRVGLIRWRRGFRCGAGEGSR